MVNGYEGLAREGGSGPRRVGMAGNGPKLAVVQIVRNVNELPCVFSSSDPQRLAFARSQFHLGVLEPGERFSSSAIAPGRVEPVAFRSIHIHLRLRRALTLGALALVPSAQAQSPAAAPPRDTILTTVHFDTLLDLPTV